LHARRSAKVLAGGSCSPNNWLMSRLGSVLPPNTFGGEVEALVVDGAGDLAPMVPEIKRAASAAIAEETARRGDLDVYGGSSTVSWDVPMSTSELNLGVYDSVPGVVRSALLSISVLNRVLGANGLRLLASSNHPLNTEEHAYQYVVNKPIYRLFRGTSQGPVATMTEGEQAMLAAVWPDEPSRGRGFDHMAHGLSAGVHVWTRTDPWSAGSHLALLSALGWMVNLITANGPVRHGRVVARDARLTTWERFLVPSRCGRDVQLGRPLPQRPRGLTDYFGWVLSFQPLAVQDLTEGGNAWEHPLAVIPPAGAPANWTILDFLELDRCQVAGSDGRIQWIEPQFGHICNSGDWFYWPATGGRLRMLAPYPEKVDAREFARAVRTGDDTAVADLLDLAGIRDNTSGALCIEGRASATTLPCELWGERGTQFVATPFVLQTAIFRAHREIWHVLEESGLSWQELTVDLPRMTNETGGFAAMIRKVAARDLARRVWRIAASRLSQAERLLVGDSVDEILERAQAPAELQLDFLQDQSRRGFRELDAVVALTDMLRVPSGP
jgi:hypothetical protein